MQGGNLRHIVISAEVISTVVGCDITPNSHLCVTKLTLSADKNYSECEKKLNDLGQKNNSNDLILFREIMQMS